ncbi:exodeoxyribonuclease I [Coxiella burnetii]|uniref:exodeoxyribonuclease I n=1 Tax=Coxiella burnetii TaxID=777 RepID=UPI0000ED028F|nr:exodeoxyribonuclease I [Coxiella burnetii]ACJ20410.1 exodeoxyribonuclease I [Coxiella burnetii CbuK_Q154]EAX31959.1 exodeoxyribonuclease I [Coxiella burnetii 'MSU Goat Q177']UYK69122.1 exonuclease domain-containing protein [Coxiella burnetii]
MSNHRKTYLFYDLETTGLNKCFDQIIQFAAIRTDEALNELNRHEILIRLNPDVIPSPEAMIIHRFSIDQMLSGKAEIEAIREIHQSVNTPGTISVGYNTLGFDDEFLRFSFYRNLLPPYTHQYDNFCGRMDLYPLTILYYLFKPNALNWPDPFDLKLENLSKANQLAEGQAHNAMVDVEASVALAKLLMNQEAMWRYVIGYFDKKTETQRLSQLPIGIQSTFGSHHEGVLIQGVFGAQLAYQAPVICLGQHNHYKNQCLWLRLDREELLSTTVDSIPQTTYAIRKKMGEQPIVLPASDRYLRLSEERLQLATESKKWLESHSQLFHHIFDYYQNFTYPKVPNLDPDAALYEVGFPTPYEDFLSQRFHLAPPAEKEKIALEFPNPIRRNQAFRLIERHYPDYLPAETQARSLGLCDYRGERRLTRETAFNQIESLKQEKSLDQEQLRLLDELDHYLRLS